MTSYTNASKSPTPSAAPCQSPPRGTAPSACTGTSAPAAPPCTPAALADKAPGIYEVLGGPRLLYRIVCDAQTAAEAAAAAARLYAWFAQDGSHVTARQLSDTAQKLCSAVGGLLAEVDVVLAAADYPPQGLDRAAGLQLAYRVSYQSLLTAARQRGLPDDYTAAPARAAAREAAFRATGLRRPAFIEEEEEETP